MKKKLLGFLIIVLSMLCLTGCLPTHYSDETRQRITEEIEEKTRDWFAKNISDAEITDMEMYEYEYGFISYVTCGHYEKDGESILFYYDTKNDKFYHSVLYDEAMEYLNKTIANAFVHEEYASVSEVNEVNFHYPTILAEESKDKANNGELIEIESVMPCTALPYELKEEDIPAEVNEILCSHSSNYIWPNIVFSEGADLKKIECDKSGFEKYPEVKHITFYVKKAPDYNGLLSITYGLENPDENYSKKTSYNYAVGSKYNDDLYARYFYTDSFYEAKGKKGQIDEALAEDAVRNGTIDFHPCDENGNDMNSGKYFYMTSSERNVTVLLKNQYKLYYIRYDNQGNEQITECRSEAWEQDDSFNNYGVILSEKKDGTIVSNVFYYE